MAHHRSVQHGNFHFMKRLARRRSAAMLSFAYMPRVDFVKPNIDQFIIEKVTLWAITKKDIEVKHVPLFNRKVGHHQQRKAQASIVSPSFSSVVSTCGCC